MRAVIQRVTEASVIIEGEVKSAIETGILLLLGIEEEDAKEDIEWLCNKVAKMRILTIAIK
jgi:D-aminoacyl-tRNA deacylase